MLQFSSRGSYFDAFSCGPVYYAVKSKALSKYLYPLEGKERERRICYFLSPFIFFADFQHVLLYTNCLTVKRLREIFYPFMISFTAGGNAKQHQKPGQKTLLS